MKSCLFSQDELINNYIEGKGIIIKKIRPELVIRKSSKHLAERQENY